MSAQNLKNLIKSLVDNKFYGSAQNASDHVKDFVATNPVGQKLTGAVVTLLATASRLGIEYVYYVTRQFAKDCADVTGASKFDIGCVTPLVSLMNNSPLEIEPLVANDPFGKWSVSGKPMNIVKGMPVPPVQEDTRLSAVLKDTTMTYHHSENVEATAKAIEVVTAYTTYAGWKVSVPNVAPEKVGMPSQVKAQQGVFTMFTGLAPILAKLDLAVKLPVKSQTRKNMSSCDWFYWLDANIHHYGEHVVDVVDSGKLRKEVFKGTMAFTIEVLQVFAPLLKGSVTVSKVGNAYNIKYPRVNISLPKILYGAGFSGVDSPSNAMALLSACREQRGTDKNTRGETYKSFYTGAHLPASYVDDVLEYRSVFAPLLSTVRRIADKDKSKHVVVQIVCDKTSKMNHVVAFSQVLKDNSATPFVTQLLGEVTVGFTILYPPNASYGAVAKMCSGSGVEYLPLSALDANLPVLYWYDKTVQYVFATHGGDKIAKYIEEVKKEFDLDRLKGAPFMITNMLAVDLYGGGFLAGPTPHNMTAFFVSDPDLATINNEKLLSAWCVASGMINWERTFAVLTGKTLLDVKKELVKKNPQAASFITPLAGRLVQAYRKAITSVEISFIGDIEVEGYVDDMVQMVDDEDEGDHYEVENVEDEDIISSAPVEAVRSDDF